VTAAGHKDKALEYGKDIWMKYTLPTQHILYFGILAKKAKLDAAGLSRGDNENVAEVLNQVTMMLGHESLTQRQPGVSWSTTRSSSLAARSRRRHGTGLATNSTQPSAARSCLWIATTS
jgi:hypothetical protein